MRLIAYLLPRIVAAAITMFGVSVLVFLSLRLLPGGYADILLGPFSTPEAREIIARRYGLDQPVVVQYLHWTGSLLTGDFGVSMVTRRPVIDEFLRRAPVTLELALIALGLALAVGYPLGVRSGTRTAKSGMRGDHARLVGALGASVPDFVLGSRWTICAPCCCRASRSRCSGSRWCCERPATRCFG